MLLLLCHQYVLCCGFEVSIVPHPVFGTVSSVWIVHCVFANFSVRTHFCPQNSECLGSAIWNAAACQQASRTVSVPGGTSQSVSRRSISWKKVLVLRFCGRGHVIRQQWWEEPVSCERCLGNLQAMRGRRLRNVTGCVPLIVSCACVCVCWGVDEGGGVGLGLPPPSLLLLKHRTGWTNPSALGALW